MYVHCVHTHIRAKYITASTCIYIYIYTLQCIYISYLQVVMKKKSFLNWSPHWCQPGWGWSWGHRACLVSSSSTPSATGRPSLHYWPEGDVHVHAYESDCLGPYIVLLLEYLSQYQVHVHVHVHVYTYMYKYVQDCTIHTETTPQHGTTDCGYSGSCSNNMTSVKENWEIPKANAE